VPNFRIFLAGCVSQEEKNSSHDTKRITQKNQLFFKHPDLQSKEKQVLFRYKQVFVKKFLEILIHLFVKLFLATTDESGESHFIERVNFRIP